MSSRKRLQTRQVSPRRPFRRTGRSGRLALLTFAAASMLAAAAHAGEAPRSARTIATSRALVGVPAGAPPDEGWPLLVMMHGYGVNKEDFASLVALLSESEVLTVALDAPHALGGGRRSWGRDPAATHAYLQAALDSLRSEVPAIPARRPSLGGFSQGAWHALALVIAHPGSYDGVLAISPGGGSVRGTLPVRDHAHRLFTVVGAKEEAGIRRAVAEAGQIWRAAGQPVRSHEHGGGHHFPPGWESLLRDAARWIVGSETSIAPAERRRRRP